MSWNPSETVIDRLAVIIGIALFCGVVMVLAWVATLFFDPSRADATVILFSAITFALGLAIGSAR